MVESWWQRRHIVHMKYSAHKVLYCSCARRTHCTTVQSKMAAEHPERINTTSRSAVCNDVVDYEVFADTDLMAFRSLGATPLRDSAMFFCVQQP